MSDPTPATNEADARPWLPSRAQVHRYDVVRRASEYLKTITSDRYDRITVGEAGDFYVRGPGEGRAVEASGLSTGAQEQLYLAIRLAVMTHLDDGRERLPAFVDETFVNWASSTSV